jgi:phosphopantetheinyl transferase
MKVFIANINSISKNPDAYTALLSPTHRARVQKFKNENRKLQFILGHLMADSCGKKHTSIAHKDCLVVVAAASNAPVGIDIENATIDRDFVGAAELMHLPIPKDKKEFYRLFTFAEATYKLGMRAHCRQFMRHGDYIICIASTRHFDMPRLTKFDAGALLPTE